MRESETVELKKSTSELKEAVISIASILNKHQEGKLYFGIKNNGQVTGQHITENTIRAISQAISNNIEPKLFPKINEIILNNKKCVCVEFSGENIPYYSYGRAYIRVGDEDKKLSSQELERLIVKKSRILWEEEISTKTLKDVDKNAIRTFVERANTVKRIDFKFTNVVAVLNKLCLLKQKKLLNATEVLFCDNSLIEVQTAVFAGKNKITFLDIKKSKGNIFDLLEQSEEYIKEHINWSAELKGIARKEIPEIPIRAISEALVNSFCHRDYANPKGNEIAIFKDRIEIYNPGQFPEGYDPEDFIKGNERSVLRNPLIANTLYLRRDVERWGSGLRRIHEECRNADIKVEFKKLKSGFLVSFHRKAESGVEKGVEKGVKRLSDNENKLLDLIRENSLISKTNMIKKGRLTKKTVEYNIESLKKKGILKRIGPAKGGYWKILN